MKYIRHGLGLRLCMGMPLRADGGRIGHLRPAHADGVPNVTRMVSALPSAMIGWEGLELRCTYHLSGAYSGVQGGECPLRRMHVRRLNPRLAGFITPGFIDVHARWNGYITTYPGRSWEMETFLAYDVTTLHK